MVQIKPMDYAFRWDCSSQVFSVGEDPYLGRMLVPRAVKGIQDKGVIANAKHYVNNNQETDRTTVSENVDERTQFEIYYPPFEAAAKAGVGSVMWCPPCTVVASAVQA